MFVPWRQLTDLKVTADTTWWAAYERLRSSIDVNDQTILRNMQTYHDSFVRKADERDLPYDKVLSNLDDDHYTGTDDHEDTSESNLTTEQQDAKIDVAPGDNASMSFLDPLLGTGFSFVNTGSVKDALDSATPVTLSDFKKSTQTKKDASAPSTQPDNATPATKSFDLQPSLLVECALGAWLDLDSLDDRPKSPVTLDDDELGHRPTIGSASRKATLNREQHRAFVLLSAALLEGVIRDVTAEQVPTIVAARELLRTVLEDAHRAKDPLQSDDGNDAPPQLRFFLSGPAGTGKSTVIKALVDFATRWGAMDAILLTATSGIAGVNIQGQTYHRAMGVAYDGDDGDDDGCKKSTRSSTVDKDRWSRIRVVVLDEVSMLGASRLDDINKHMKRLKANESIFGGVHMAFFGDIFQLGPVQNASLFGHRGGAASKGSNGKEYKKATLNGIRLWHSLNACLELTTCVRQQSDTEFADALGRYRTAELTRSDLKLVNQVCLRVQHLFFHAITSWLTTFLYLTSWLTTFLYLTSWLL
jgi:hypothetical protein